MEDLYKFFGLLIYMSLVSLLSLQDYWRQNHIFSVPLPAKVMTIDRFRSILWNIHLSEPEEDAQNESKKGTLGHDRQASLWQHPQHLPGLLPPEERAGSGWKDGGD